MAGPQPGDEARRRRGRLATAGAGGCTVDRTLLEVPAPSRLDEEPPVGGRTSDAR